MSGIDKVLPSPFASFQKVTVQNPANSYALPSAAENHDDCFSKSICSPKRENTDKIGFFRLAFKRLTQEQIDNINETRQLPKNAKFRQGATGPKGGFHIQNNIFHLTSGTRTLPEGYEVRKNKLGFTRVVPIDSEGFWLKKKTPKA